MHRLSSSVCVSCRRRLPTRGGSWSRDSASVSSTVSLAPFRTGRRKENASCSDAPALLEDAEAEGIGTTGAATGLQGPLLSTSRNTLLQHWSLQALHLMDSLPCAIERLGSCPRSFIFLMKSSGEIFLRLLSGGGSATSSSTCSSLWSDSYSWIRARMPTNRFCTLTVLPTDKNVG